MEQLNRLSKISEWVLIGYLVFIYESTSTNILKNILGREMDKIMAWSLALPLHGYILTNLYLYQLHDSVYSNHNMISSAITMGSSIVSGFQKGVSVR